MRRNAAWYAALLVLSAGRVHAQGIGRGFDLERVGRFEDAAASYLAVVRAAPADLPALLGLERVLPRLDRTRELLPLAQRAVTSDTASDALRGLLVRTYVTLNLTDSAAQVAQRWARARPGDEAPYREWATALSDAHAYDAAQQVLLNGRKSLGRRGAFAIELAGLAARAGDWEGAAREWGDAVTRAPVQAPNAVEALADAPAVRRDGMIRALAARDPSAQSRRLAAELLLGWGDPARAWLMFDATTDAPTAETAYALRRFADLAGALGTPAGWRARGLALVRFAGIAPEPLAVRARAEAARAFLEAQDAGAAEAQLALVADDPAAPADAQRMAQATLIRARIQAGQLDSATADLARLGDRLGGDDIRALRIALARARVAQGDLAAAAEALGSDSSVAALSVRGWIALYRGDLRAARVWFRAAGPYAGDRREATERTTMLALLEQIPDSESRPLGRALLTLERGDSSGAVTAIRQAAEQLTGRGVGRAELSYLAGRICERLGREGEANAAALYDAAMRAGGTGAAPPAAELAWAELLLRQGERDGAVRHLEHLILTYPESALVPEARRVLDRAKGAVPES